MSKEQYELFKKVHNELLDRLQIKADKYEREDSFSAIFEVDNGKSMQNALTEVFAAVYNVEVSDVIYKSCYAACVGCK